MGNPAPHEQVRNLQESSIHKEDPRMTKDTYSSHASQRMMELEGAPLASFQRRAGAFLLDFIILAAGAMGAVFVGATVGQWLNLLPPDANIQLEFNLANWYSVVAVVVYFGIVTYIGKGQTPGKLLMRIRVVSTLHPKLSFWHSLERAFGYSASALELGSGFFQYFIADNRQTTHDRIAGTIVVTVPKKPPANPPASGESRRRRRSSRRSRT